MHLRFALLSFAIAAGLFIAMMVFLEVGRRMGIRDVEKRGEKVRAGVGIVDSAVYAVLALLIGFTFSSATSRFEKRRDLIAQEANAMSTAWQRIDMLPVPLQSGIRDSFKRYLDALLASYRTAPGSVDELRHRTTAKQAESELWTRSVAATLDPNGEKARMLLLPSLNETFDVVQTERFARRMHPPFVVYAMLG